MIIIVFLQVHEQNFHHWSVNSLQRSNWSIRDFFLWLFTYFVTSSENVSFCVWNSCVEEICWKILEVSMHLVYWLTCINKKKHYICHRIYKTYTHLLNDDCYSFMVCVIFWVKLRFEHQLSIQISNIGVVKKVTFYVGWLLYNLCKIQLVKDCS